MRSMRLLAGAALLSMMAAVPALAQSYHYKLIDKIQLPGKTGHGDFVLYDPTNEYVYVSLPDGAAVIDTRTNKVVASLPSISDPNSMAFDDDYVYWTIAKDDGPNKVNQIAVVDKKTWKVVNTVNTAGTSPDGMWLDPDSHKIYVAMDDNNDIEVYGTGKSPALQGKIALYPSKGSGPDVGTLVPSKDTLYMPDDAWEEAVSLSKGAITQKTDTGIKVGKKGGTKGQIYDPKTNRLWVGTATGLKIVKRLSEKGGADEVDFDPRLGLVYAFEAKPKGFDIYDAKTMRHVGFVTTGVSETHTGAVDTKTDDVYAYAGGGAAMYVYKPEK